MPRARVFASRAFASRRSASRSSAGLSTRPGATGPGERRVWGGRFRRVGDVASTSHGRRALVLAGIFIVMLVLVAPTVRAYFGQRSDIASIQDRLAEQEAKVAELAAEKARWEDDSFVEQQARQRLKFVRPGEKSYTVLDGDERVAPTVIPGMAPSPGGLPWYSTLSASLAAADAPSLRRP